ncbi:CotH kinase family protein [Balneolaceae bacterium ANBcel3]|nr:CotH kinase family protein [Balneolaceae bacterium ANBcel3]
MFHCWEICFRITSIRRRTGLSLLFSLILLIPITSRAQTAPPVLINEIQSSNSRTYADEEGDYEDWIELFNPSTDTIRLGGFGLSDDPSRPYRWVFPEGSYIEPESYLLIWASGKNRRNPESPLHTNFRIQSRGEDVLLSWFTVPDGSDTPVLDHWKPVPVPTDYSYGRYPDGVDQKRLFAEPTPDAPNTYSPLQGVLDAPVFSHPPGFYTEPFDLELYATDPEAVIHYTTDGSTPGPDSPIYTGPIAIEAGKGGNQHLSLIRTAPRFWSLPDQPIFTGTVLRAIQIREGYHPGEPVAGTWFVDPAGRNRYTFPVLSILVDENDLFSDETGIYVPGDHYDPDQIYSGNYYMRGEDWERPAHLLFWEEGSAQITGEGLSSSAGFSQQGGLRIHGGATRRYPQKSLRFYARNIYDWDSELHYPLFPGLRKAGSESPLETFKRFILRSSGDDWFHTMFKDAMVQSLIGDRMIDVQAYRPAVVFLNGEYWGIHNIRERFDGWYIETNYDIHRDDVVILLDNAEVNHGEPEDDQHFLEMRAFIETKDLSEEEEFREVEQWMDIENYLDYVTFQVYAANADWPHNNVRFWRKKTDAYDSGASYGADGRWRWMVFDMDASFGFPYEGDQSWWSQYDHNMIEWITGFGNPRRREGWVNALFNGLIENDVFKNRFMNQLLADVHSRYKPEFVVERIESFRNAYEKEIEEHISRYPFSAGRSLAGWNQHIDRMIEFAEKRPEYLLNDLMNHFEVGPAHELHVKTNQGRGYVKVNDTPANRKTPGIESDSFWQTMGFEGVPVYLEAVPAEQEYFWGWWIDGVPVEELDRTDIQVDGKHMVWNPNSDTNIEAHFSSFESTGSDPEILHTFRLKPNYPNPFNHQTIIPFEIPGAGEVWIRIYSIEGRLVSEKRKSARTVGSYTYAHRSEGWATGVYVYSVTWVAANGQERMSDQRKMLYLR